MWVVKVSFYDCTVILGHVPDLFLRRCASLWAARLPSATASNASIVTRLPLCQADLKPDFL